MKVQRAAAVLASVAVIAACSGSGDAPPRGDVGTPEPAATDTGRPPATTPAPPGTSPTGPVTATYQPPPTFDPEQAMATVQHLAGEIGPREATSPAFHDAAAWVADQFTALGYDVEQVDVRVPEGDTSYQPEWGTIVEPGTSANVIADLPGFDVAEPHVVIGAHLDTVAVAPGAEDNASGIAVLLELARLAAAAPPPVDVRFIAFGAEEPRGSGDQMHHFGSQQYVRDLPTTDPVTAMVSLDRVGVAASSVPICTGGTGTTEVRNALLEAAQDAGIAAQPCENRTSDHWSFEKAQVPAARLGSVPYGEYHSPRDGPEVVDATQLERAGAIVWQWLQAAA
ncbi:MAG TPA: M28 family peptidase [Jiangellaceae bacterium]